MEKKLLLSKLQMSYYPEPDSHIKFKVKIVLILSNNATKKELVNAPTSLNTLKTKVDDLDE